MVFDILFIMFGNSMTQFGSQTNKNKSQMLNVTGIIG